MKEHDAHLSGLFSINRDAKIPLGLRDESFRDDQLRSCDAEVDADPGKDPFLLLHVLV